MGKRLYEGKVCLYDGCEDTPKTRGYCGRHYTQLWRSGTIVARPLRKELKCSVDGCERNVYGRSLCAKHYQRFRKHGNVLYKEMSMHGLSKVPEYSIWENIKDRCYRESNLSFKNYGARGIGVCDRWLAGFVFFYEDMGPRPSEKHEIDRINNDGNYEPGNCRWVTRTENARNRRNNKLTMEMAEAIRREHKDDGLGAHRLSKKYHISKTTASMVLKNKIWRDE